MSFEGTYTAVVTPFRADGSLDLGTLAASLFESFDCIGTKRGGPLHRSRCSRSWRKNRFRSFWMCQDCVIGDSPQNTPELRSHRKG